jgi:hypothetical protein
MVTINELVRIVARIAGKAHPHQARRRAARGARPQLRQRFCRSVLEWEPPTDVAIGAQADLPVDREAGPQRAQAREGRLASPSVRDPEALRPRGHSAKSLASLHACGPLPLRSWHAADGMHAVRSPFTVSDFWRSRRAVVTGGAGFIGSAVCRALRERARNSSARRGAANTT